MSAHVDKLAQLGITIADNLAKGGCRNMLVTAMIAGLVVLGLFLSMLSSSPRTGR